MYIVNIDQNNVHFFGDTVHCNSMYIVLVYRQIKTNSTKEGGHSMKTYLLYEDGEQVGQIDLDPEEVKALENIGIELKEVAA